MKIIVPYGSGVNSTAMLIEMVKRNIKPDYILFANTGGWSNIGEKYETYRYKRFFSRWLKSKGFPGITTIVYNQEGLYRECMRLSNLPSVAFEFKTCSQKWKIRAQDNWIKRNLRSNNYVKFIGYDSSESHRTYKHYSQVRYPLVEWNLDRFDCMNIIINSGMPLPPKSSCFFCPNMKNSEIKSLAENDSCRFKLALEMEANWEHSGKSTKRVKGLGRKHKWEDIIKLPVIDFDLEDDYLTLEDMPCACSF